MQDDRSNGSGTSVTANAARHHVALILACALIGAAAAWFYVASQPHSYTSSSSVLINPVEGNPFAPAASVRNDVLTSLETEAQIVRSDAVLRGAADAAPGSLSPDELAKRLLVVVPTNTQILQISYSASDPVIARDTARAIVGTYLDLRRQRSESVSAAQLDRLKTQTESVIEDLRAATAGAQSGSTAKREFQTELADALNSQLVNLRAQQTALENAAPRPGEIISPAALPSSGGPLTQLVFPFAGGLAGLLLGYSIALLVEHTRGLLRSAHDVEATGTTVLAAIPPTTRFLPRSKRTASRGFDEAIRRVRGVVLDANPLGAIVAVSHGSDRGVAPHVARALAASLARAGQNVVLVDAAQPPVSRREVQARPGLSDLLSGNRGDVHALLIQSSEPRLRVLPAGGTSPDTSEYFVTDRLTTALAPVVRASDFVILDAPSLQLTQGEALARVADMTIMVVASAATRRSDLVRTVRWAHQAGVDLAALVVPRRGRLALTSGAAGRVDDGSSVGAPSRSIDQQSATSSAP